MLAESIDTYGFKERGDRFTGSDGQKLKSELRAEMSESYPPRWLINEIEHLRGELDEVRLEDRRLQVQIQALDCRELGDHYVPPTSSYDPDMFDSSGG